MSVVVRDLCNVCRTELCRAGAGVATAKERTSLFGPVRVRDCCLALFVRVAVRPKKCTISGHFEGVRPLFLLRADYVQQEKQLSTDRTHTHKIGQSCFTFHFSLSN